MEARTDPHAPSTHPRHSSPTLFTAHASRTHVKGPQTDFPVKHDNLSGPTHDSLSETPLRTKVTFQQKSTEKALRTQSRERTTQARHGPTHLHALAQSGIWLRPEGQHRTQDGLPLDSQSHGRSFEASGQTPWLHSTTPKPPRLSHDRSQLQSLWIGVGSPPERNAGPSGSRVTRLSLEYPTRVSL